MIKFIQNHWPSQEPKLEVPTIYRAHFLGLCKGISPQNEAFCGTVPPIRFKSWPWTMMKVAAMLKSNTFLAVTPKWKNGFY